MQALMRARCRWRVPFIGWLFQVAGVLLINRSAPPPERRLPSYFARGRDRWMRAKRWRNNKLLGPARKRPRTNAERSTIHGYHATSLAAEVRDTFALDRSRRVRIIERGNRTFASPYFIQAARPWPRNLRAATDHEISRRRLRPPRRRHLIFGDFRRPSSVW